MTTFHRPERLYSFDFFRAIAIVFIVASHSFTITGMQASSTTDILLTNIIAGGTFLFLFISGFLFHHIFYPRFCYRRFMEKKCQQVLMPFLTLSLVPITWFITHPSPWFGGIFLPTGESLLSQYAIPALKYLLSGRFMTGYWYIPFIMLVFLSSPLHIKFIHMPLKWQFAIITLWSILALLIHRPEDNINIIQSVIYFTPFYLIGICSSIHKAHLYAFFKGREWWLLMGAILCLTIQTASGHIGNYHKAIFCYQGIDWLFLQKLFVCLFLMVFLTRFDHRRNRLVQDLASTSFTVFFLHTFIIWTLNKIAPDLFNIGLWPVFIGFVMALCLICINIAKATKYLIPQYSRFLTGY